ncbi:helix-turn-helix domain-containing protein [Nocardia sp. NBC_01503]|uniref:helix-turn-helix domain-containing protein n=1 Tax=Nocardia sp. NBC_01503 TaxID=2975997 RepID=UPI002E7ABDFB|nr:AraC family transcriptional regulator [Nocardia sp. NBC_01503]WTL36444.1 helix-turn-helix domain-containing protein [Nocardia sp. NBC_01503]
MDLACGSGAGWDFAGVADAALGGAMIGYRDLCGSGLGLQVAGTAAITVLIGFGDREVIVDDAVGRRTSGGFVVGLPVEAMCVRSERAECVEVRLSPLRAYSLLGIAPTDLGRGAVGLEELWGSRVQRLRARLAESRSWDDRFALTKSFLTQGERPMRAPDPEVLSGWNRILRSHGQVRIGELAEDVGWSHKRLGARFESQIGLAPKRAAMLVRFRYAVDGLLAGRPAADVAIESGYTDQAHLCRDVSIFADRTPRALSAAYQPAISRYRYRAWGKFFQYRAEPAVR